MATDVITKFYYLEHGKNAPKYSSYKGIITAETIIGYQQYTERDSAKVLHEDAQKINDEHDQHTFFNYTTGRIGSTKTYTSRGWIENKTDERNFKKLIQSSFNQDGQFMYCGIISLKDYLTASEMKMYDEKDYAMVIEKVLPDFFKSAGFNPDNMEWWMDHHVNTDNPHVHLTFFEKEKTKEFGKLPMKSINRFKKSFWNEVFAKKRFLDQVGIEAKDNFKNRDVLKKSALNEFKTKLAACNDKEFRKMLIAFASKLPEDGRLQYGSAAMIPYRAELDLLVDYMLHTPEIVDRYQQFMDCVKKFDHVYDSNVNTKNKYSFSKTEDKKLRKIMANEILQECKKCKAEFHEKASEECERLSDIPDHDAFMIPVSNSLIKKIKNNSDHVLIRLPGTKSYIRMNADRLFNSAVNGQSHYVAINTDDMFQLYDADNHLTNQITPLPGNNADEDIHILSADDIHKFFDMKDIVDFKNEYKDFEKKEWYSQKQNDFIQKDYNWKKSSKKLGHASFSWMNKIQSEVKQALNEYYSGKDLSMYG